MVVKLLVLVAGGVSSISIGPMVRITSVKDTLIVMSPSEAGKLDFGQDLVVILSCQVKDVEMLCKQPYHCSYQSPRSENGRRTNQIQTWTTRTQMFRHLH